MTENNSSILDTDDDAPDLSLPEWRSKVEAALSRKKGGRPPKSVADRKVATTLRLDPIVLDGLRALGPGWQTKINDILGEWISEHRSPSP